MIVGSIGLKYLVESLKEEGPEIVDWSKIADLLEYMCHPVVIWLDEVRVKLRYFKC